MHRNTGRYGVWASRLALAVGVSLAASAASAQNIRMWTFLDPAGKDPREKALTMMIANFEKANPGVKIQVEPQVWQQMTDKFFAAHQTGTAPDVMWVHLRRVPDAIALGSLANLDELLDRKSHV